MLGKYKLTLLVPIIIIFTFLSMSVMQYQKNIAKIEKDMALNLRLIESNVGLSIKDNLDKMKGLATYISLNPNFDELDMNYFISKLLEGDDNIISNIGIFEDTTAVHLYPYDENAVMDHIDLMDLPLFKDDALRVKNEFETIITAPSETLQGGLGIIIRLPITLKDGTYWGQIGYMMRYEDVIEAVGLNDTDFLVQITQLNKNSDDMFIVYDSGFNIHSVSNAISLNLPSSQWIISMSNRSIFSALTLSTWLFVVLGLILAYLASRTLKEIEFNQFMMKGIVETSPDFIILLDEKNRIVNCSQLVLDYLNRSKLKIVGKNIEILLSDKQYKEGSKDDSILSFVAKELSNNISLLNINGDEKYFNLRKIDLTQKRGYILSGQDIDSIKKQELATKEAMEIAEQTAEMQSRFLANMSHEIRTPMNGILGMIDLSLMEEINDTVEDYLSTAKESGKSLLVIINDILDFSKIEVNKVSLSEETVDLRKMLINSMKLYEYKAQENKLKLEFNVEDQVPKYVIGDPVRIGQVINNLLSNAFKFTQMGRVSLKVECRAIDDDVAKLYFTVQDTGIGIPKEKLSSLFERFNQLDDSITRSYGGTGLGLAVSKGLVELMNGKIHCESIVGKGTTFEIFLPLEYTNNVMQSSDINLDTQVYEYESSFRVLVVDDDKVNRKVMTAVLIKLGYDTVSVCNGKEAVDICKQEVFNLILIDLSMPVMDGFEAIKIIRMINGYEKNKVKIVALTAFASQRDRENCFSRGFDDFLTKPIDIHAIGDKMLDWNKSYVLDEESVN